MKAITKTFQYGEHEVTMETGAIARQADGAVMVTMAETSVLVTAVGRKAADPGRDGKIHRRTFNGPNFSGRDGVCIRYRREGIGVDHHLVCIQCLGAGGMSGEKRLRAWIQVHSSKQNRFCGGLR